MKAIERIIIRKLIRSMKAQGYRVAAVWDGGEYQFAGGYHTSGSALIPNEISKPLTESEALAAVFSVDTSTLHFTHRNANTWGNRGVFIVLGNGEDCLSDWHAPSEAVEPFAAVPMTVMDDVARANA